MNLPYSSSKFTLLPAVFQNSFQGICLNLIPQQLFGYIYEFRPSFIVDDPSFKVNSFDLFRFLFGTPLPKFNPGNPQNGEDQD